ncbi:MAG: type IV secretory system conjugative DNA transfer family protein [Alphaproteobacteria bacterium]|nr:type IV secretory system conjugative DNA transfer family protein [Alphaproteobacteria bacterium]
MPDSRRKRYVPLWVVMISFSVALFCQNTSFFVFVSGQAKPDYTHKLLLMMDEFTSIGKLDIYEKSLAYMRGYGVKSYLIVQDVKQLHKEYGDRNTIFSNSNIRITFAATDPDTQQLISRV